MSHRTRRSVVIALPLLCFLAVIGSGHPEAAAQETGGLELGLEDIEAFALGNSPHLRIAALEVEIADAERRSALAWSNPALAYDHEEATSLSEWQFTLQKRIDRPLARGRLREAWDGRVRAAELRSRHASGNLVAELKAGYVRVRLMESHRDRLARLGELVDLAAGVAGSRHAEGELSGLERRLIQLAAYAIATAESGLRSRHEQLLASWRADMGIDASRPLTLATPITFRPVEPADAGSYRGRLAAMPGDQAQVEAARSLEAQAAAARPGLIPGLGVYGGYKRFDADRDGFVAGIAVDLPLFDAGNGEAGRLRAERLIVENALAVDRTRREGEIAALVAALRTAQPLLAAFAAEAGGESLAGVLLVSYREGAITLDELLGALQVEAAAIEAYFADLATYYENIFRLEALTGAELVNFAP